ncbi:MAG TPA: hypothetical protein VI336_02250, partial [Candidatus Saccharimonadales bacterium]|nr:hypothetical protein [Candidatus Saccharimonadales bacterium]
MKLELPDELSSRQDLKALILEIRGYVRWANQAVVKERYGTRNQTAPTLSGPAVNLIRKWHGEQTINLKRLDELIITLEDYAATAPSITITLAAAPSIQLKNALIGWCRRNIKTDILVNFKFNSTMLGGMVVSYGSHVHDWSFKRRIMVSTARFPEVLRR